MGSEWNRNNVSFQSGALIEAAESIPSAASASYLLHILKRFHEINHFPTDYFGVVGRVIALEGRRCHMQERLLDGNMERNQFPNRISIIWI